MVKPFDFHQERIRNHFVASFAAVSGRNYLESYYLLSGLYAVLKPHEIFNDVVSCLAKMTKGQCALNSFANDCAVLKEDGDEDNRYQPEERDAMLWFNQIYNDSIIRKSLADTMRELTGFSRLDKRGILV